MFESSRSYCTIIIASSHYFLNYQMKIYEILTYFSWEITLDISFLEVSINTVKFAVRNTEHIKSPLGGRRSTCSLVLLKYLSIFPCSPNKKILIFYVPCFPKLYLFPCSVHFRLVFPCFPEINDIPLFPITPGRAS